MTDQDALVPGDLLIAPDEKNEDRLKDVANFANVYGPLEKVKDWNYRLQKTFPGAPEIFQPQNNLCLVHTDDGRYYLLAKDGHTVFGYDINYRPLCQMNILDKNDKTFIPISMNFFHKPSGDQLEFISNKWEIIIVDIPKPPEFQPLSTVTPTPNQPHNPWQKQLIEYKESSTEPTNPPMNPPRNFNIVIVNNIAHISWDPESKAVGYYLYVGLDKKFFDKHITKTDFPLGDPNQAPTRVFSLSILYEKGEGTLYGIIVSSKISKFTSSCINTTSLNNEVTKYSTKAQQDWKCGKLTEKQFLDLFKRLFGIHCKALDLSRHNDNLDLTTAQYAQCLKELNKIASSIP